MRSIAGLFGKSPFIPLQEHINKVTACVEQMQPLFNALLAGDKEEVRRIIELIYAGERQADEIKNAIRESMPRSIFMPVSRPDFLQLLDVQDGIADTVQDIAVLMSVHAPQLPEGFSEHLLELVDHAVQSCRQLTEIYQHLSDLLETSFRGKPADETLEAIEEVASTEHKADKVALTLLDRLFNNSEGLPIQDFIMLDKVMVKISHVSDLARKTSNRIRIILSR
jgi:uncharacterized protein